MNWSAVLILALVAAAVFGLVIAAMAVGVIFSGRRIKGSCGGLATMRDGDGQPACMACGGAPENCDEAAQAEGDETHRAREEAEAR